MHESSIIQRDLSLFIAGEWRRPAEPERIAVIDPSTGERFTHIAGAGALDVDAAVEAASEVLPDWRRLSGAERGRFLAAFAEAIGRHRRALVAVQMRNSGKPRSECEIDVDDAIATFQYYSGLAADLDRRQESPVALPDSAFAGSTRFEPLGPVGMIVPWNFPLVTSAWKIAPALAAGCTVVLKTSEFTPLVELAYGDIAREVGLPAGVLNLLTGTGIVGAAITADPRLRKLSFTGSNAIGSKVMAAAAPRSVPVSLELGGKSPIVVFADAPVEHAVDCILAGIFFNCGQMCSATSRLLVEEKAAPALLECLTERTKALRVGPPSEEASEMGPLTTAPQYRRVLATLDLAKADRLRCLAGGSAIDRRGQFVAPTVYDEVPADHRLWREEIFGPVLCVRRFASEDEAVRLANDSDYGLVATVVTGDPERARRVAAALDAGHVWVNSKQVIFPHTAWGGFKASGIGRELGPWGLSAYLGVKHITTARAA